MPIRFTHTGIEVKDLEESLKFCTQILKMKLLDRHKIPETGGEVAAAVRLVAATGKLIFDQCDKGVRQPIGT